MTIDSQLSLIRSIQASLVKEAAEHRKCGNTMGAELCEEQEVGLRDVASTLRAAKCLRESYQQFNELIAN